MRHKARLHPQVNVCCPLHIIAQQKSRPATSIRLAEPSPASLRAEPSSPCDNSSREHCPCCLTQFAAHFRYSHPQHSAPHRWPAFLCQSGNRIVATHNRRLRWPLPRFTQTMSFEASRSSFSVRASLKSLRRILSASGQPGEATHVAPFISPAGSPRLITLFADSFSMSSQRSAPHPRLQIAGPRNAACFPFEIQTSDPVIQRRALRPLQSDSHRTAYPRAPTHTNKAPSKPRLIALKTADTCSASSSCPLLPQSLRHRS